VLASQEFGQFDGDFLVAWGARYTPMMRYEAGQWWRWISSCALFTPADRCRSRRSARSVG